MRSCFPEITFAAKSSFGSVMNTRNWSASSYRYGFNGQEKDNEINVDGGSYDFGARIYDGRLGRWLAADPLYKRYPFFTPYSFAGNCPLVVVDKEGEVLKLNGDVASYRKFESVFNRTFGSSAKVTVDNVTGEVSVTRDNTKSISRNDQKLFDALSAVVQDSKEIHIQVAKNATERSSATGGSWRGGLSSDGTIVCNLVDLDDMNKMDGRGASPEGYVIHEIWETYVDQKEKACFPLGTTDEQMYNNAHNQAVCTQAGVDGTIISHQEFAQVNIGTATSPNIVDAGKTSFIRGNKLMNVYVQIDASNNFVRVLGETQGWEVDDPAHPGSSITINTIAEATANGVSLPSCPATSTSGCQTPAP